MPEIQKFVVLAVVAVTIVVDANGMESADDAGAEKVIDGDTEPTTVKAEHRIPDEHDAEDVATESNPPLPLPYKSCDEVNVV